MPVQAARVSRTPTCTSVVSQVLSRSSNLSRSFLPAARSSVPASSTIIRLVRVIYTPSPPNPTTDTIYRVGQKVSHTFLPISLPNTGRFSFSLAYSVEHLVKLRTKMCGLLFWPTWYNEMVETSQMNWKRWVRTVFKQHRFILIWVDLVKVHLVPCLGVQFSWTRVAAEFVLSTLARQLTRRNARKNNYPNLCC